MWLHGSIIFLNQSNQELWNFYAALPGWIELLAKELRKPWPMKLGNENFVLSFLQVWVTKESSVLEKKVTEKLCLATLMSKSVATRQIEVKMSTLFISFNKRFKGTAIVDSQKDIGTRQSEVEMSTPFISLFDRRF